MARNNKITVALDQFIGEKLYNLRKQNKRTRSELGQILLISSQQVAKYESGENRISASRLFLIAKLFNKSTDFFYEGFKECNLPEGNSWKLLCA